MAASLLSESAGDEPTASVGVGAGLAIVRPVMSWKGRFNSKILLKLAKSIAQMANCPHDLQLRALTTTTPPSRTEADNLLAETRGDMMNKKLTHQK